VTAAFTSGPPSNLPRIVMEKASPQMKTMNNQNTQAETSMNQYPALSSFVAMERAIGLKEDTR